MRTNPTSLLDTKRTTQTNHLETIPATRNTRIIYQFPWGGGNHPKKQRNQPAEEQAPRKNRNRRGSTPQGIDGDTANHSSSRRTPGRRIGVTVIDRHTWSSSAFQEASLRNRIDPPTKITETETDTAPIKQQKKDEKSHLPPPPPPPPRRPFSAARLSASGFMWSGCQGQARKVYFILFYFLPPLTLFSTRFPIAHVLRVPQAYCKYYFLHYALTCCYANLFCINLIFHKVFYW